MSLITAFMFSVPVLAKDKKWIEVLMKAPGAPGVAYQARYDRLWLKAKNARRKASVLRIKAETKERQVSEAINSRRIKDARLYRLQAVLFRLKAKNFERAAWRFAARAYRAALARKKCSRKKRKSGGEKKQ